MHVDRKQKTVPENNTIYLTLKDSRAFSPRQPWPKILSKVMKKNVKKQHWVKVKGGIEKVWTYNKHVTMIIVPLTRSVNKQKTLVRLQIVHSSYGLCLRMINQITITGYSFASSDRSRSLRKFATDRSGCRFHHFEIRCHRSLGFTRTAQQRQMTILKRTVLQLDWRNKMAEQQEEDEAHTWVPKKKEKSKKKKKSFGSTSGLEKVIKLTRCKSYATCASEPYQRRKVTRHTLRPPEKPT